MINKTNQSSAVTPPSGINFLRAAKPLICAAVMLLGFTTASAGHQLTVDSDGDGKLDWVDDDGLLWSSCDAWYASLFGTNLTEQQQWALDTCGDYNAPVYLDASGSWTLTDPNATPPAADPGSTPPPSGYTDIYGNPWASEAAYHAANPNGFYDLSGRFYTSEADYQAYQASLNATSPADSSNSPSADPNDYSDLAAIAHAYGYAAIDKTTTRWSDYMARLSQDRSSGSNCLDSDGDGMPDYWEIDNGLNPFDASDASQDPDNDGLTNLQEYQFGTDPNNADTFMRGLPDGWELQNGLDANPRESAADAQQRLLAAKPLQTASDDLVTPADANNAQQPAGNNGGGFWSDLGNFLSTFGSNWLQQFIWNDSPVDLGTFDALEGIYSGEGGGAGPAIIDNKTYQQAFEAWSNNPESGSGPNQLDYVGTLKK